MVTPRHATVALSAVPADGRGTRFGRGHRRRWSFLGEQHQVELHGPLAQQRSGRAHRPMALPQDDVGLPQADQSGGVRRHRHLRLPHLADVRRLRRAGQVPGNGAGPRPGRDHQHLPRRRLRHPQLRPAPSRDPREHSRGLPGDHGSLVGGRAEQHHRDARDAVLRHGTDHARTSSRSPPNCGTRSARSPPATG